MEKNKGVAPDLTKKQARQLVYNKLAEALSEYKKDVKKKKFKAALKKTSKMLAADIARATHKTS
jgi:hypothetical protein